MEKITPEKERDHGNTHIFFEMSGEEDTNLLREIEKHEGLVRVFVHPSYEEYSKFDITKDEDKQRLLELEEAFRRVLASQSEQLPPLFVFDGGYSLEEFEKEEKRLSEVSGANDVYIIRSRPTHPAPIYPDRVRHNKRGSLFLDKEEREERDSMWSLLIEEFKRLGVRRVFVGGLELYTSKDEGSDEEVAPGGCVGAVIKHLRGKFEIEFSRLTWPDQIQKKRN